MISLRSKVLVRQALQQLNLHPTIIGAGEVEINELLSPKRYETVKNFLRNKDFELIADKEFILLEKIRAVVIEMVHYSEEFPNIKYSEYISRKLNLNYTYLSKFFSRLKKITIEQFIIVHRIEKAKQLLLYEQLTLSEIAWKLNYSSPAHLSTQFKKITGLTPSLFKKSKDKKLIPVEEL